MLSDKDFMKLKTGRTGIKQFNLINKQLNTNVCTNWLTNIYLELHALTYVRIIIQLNKKFKFK